MKKTLKSFRFLSLCIYAILCCSYLTSCGKDDNDGPTGSSASIVGTWVDGYGTLTLGKDGSYREDSSSGQYRIGSYSYNPANSLMIVNIKAIEGMNSAYQSTYIVQNLTSTTLVLLYTDGDVKGFYTRK